MHNPLDQIKKPVTSEGKGIKEEDLGIDADTYILLIDKLGAAIALKLARLPEIYAQCIT